MSNSPTFDTVAPQFPPPIHASSARKGALRDLFRAILNAFSRKPDQDRIAFFGREEGHEIWAATGGTSDTARFISKQTKKGREQLFRSISLGAAHTATQKGLQDLIEQCSEPNWDGYGAVPVKESVLSNASQFADLVPMGLMVPSIGAEPDGSITFEWYASPRKTLSVSIDEEGTLHYAALIGPGRAYGSEAFVGLLPRQILDLIYRVSVA